MRALQLLTLALLVTAAKADSLPSPTPVPLYPFFYTCASGVIDCSDFAPDEATQAPPFDAAAQDPNGYYAAELAGFFPSPPTFVQASSNSSGEAVGYLEDLPYCCPEPVLYFDGQVYSPGAALPSIGPINENGLYLLNGIDGPFIGSQSFVNSGPGLAAYVTAPACMVVGCYVEGSASGINNDNQILISNPLGEGVLSPFAVPEPSALLLFAVVIGLCIPKLTLAKTRQSPRTH